MDLRRLEERSFQKGKQAALMLSHVTHKEQARHDAWRAGRRVVPLIAKCEYSLYKCLSRCARRARITRLIALRTGDNEVARKSSTTTAPPRVSTQRRADMCDRELNRPRDPIASTRARALSTRENLHQPMTDGSLAQITRLRCATLRHRGPACPALSRRTSAVGARDHRVMAYKLSATACVVISRLQRCCATL